MKKLLFTIACFAYLLPQHYGQAAQFTAKHIRAASKFTLGNVSVTAITADSALVGVTNSHLVTGLALKQYVLNHVDDFKMPNGTSDGQVLKWNGLQWLPGTDNIGAGSESDPTVPAHVKSITTTNITNWNSAFGWGNHASAGYLTALPGAGGDATGTLGNMTVTKIQGRSIFNTAPSDAQVLKWSAANTRWEPSADAGLTSESDPNVPSHVKSITTTNITNWNSAFGWGNHAIAGYLTALPGAGGDATGTLPALTVTRIQGRSIFNTAPSDAQVLKWSAANSRWEPAADAGLTSESDPNVPSHVKSITTTNITNWNSAFGWGNHASAGYLTALPGAGGDATGTLAALTVTKIQGRSIFNTAPTDGQVLKWSAANLRWEPANDVGGGSGDNWGSQVVLVSSKFSGNGTSGNALDLAANAVGNNEISNGAVTAAKLNQMSATNGQVLKWNGTAWAPAADATGGGGGGIGVAQYVTLSADYTTTTENADENIGTLETPTLAAGTIWEIECNFFATPSASTVGFGAGIAVTGTNTQRGFFTQFTTATVNSRTEITGAPPTVTVANTVPSGGSTVVYKVMFSATTDSKWRPIIRVEPATAGADTQTISKIGTFIKYTQIQ